MSNASVLWPLLLATEHSEQDLGAERVAFALALAATAPAQPLAVVMPLLSNPEYEAVAPQLAARAEADIARRREALVAAAAAAGSGLTLSVQVRRGSEPYAEIVAAAREQQSALLVIRRRGKRGLLANLLIGEMVSKVLAHAPCSVLVVPREAGPIGGAIGRGLLVGVDPKVRGGTLVAHAGAMAAALGQTLHLVCVVPREAERAQAEEALAGACTGLVGPPASTEVRIGMAHAEIIAEAKARDADLIAVARHGGSTLGRAWIGGVAQKVIGLAGCAVLVQVDAVQRRPASS